MDASYVMARDRRSIPRWDDAPVSPNMVPCPEGEPPAVEAQWRALSATCGRMSAGDVVMLLELARCLADLEEA